MLSILSIALITLLPTIVNFHLVVLRILILSERKIEIMPIA